LIYDDACHLKRFSTNSSRCKQTETSKKIASMKMVVDRFHFKGHVDRWCQENCNPDKCDELKGVSECFAYVTKFAKETVILAHF